MRRVAMDVVAPQHKAVDELLEGWGEWARQRRSGSCGSIESNYRSPWWQWHEPRTRIERRSSLPLAVEKVMREVPMGHRNALVLHYQRKKPPSAICNALALNYAAFPRFMFDARQMVLNLLRRHGVVLQSPPQSDPDDGCGLAGPAVLMAIT